MIFSQRALILKLLIFHKIDMTEWLTSFMHSYSNRVKAGYRQCTYFMKRSVISELAFYGLKISDSIHAFTQRLAQSRPMSLFHGRSIILLQTKIDTRNWCLIDWKFLTSTIPKIRFYWIIPASYKRVLLARTLTEALRSSLLSLSSSKFWWACLQGPVFFPANECEKYPYMFVLTFRLANQKTEQRLLWPKFWPLPALDQALSSDVNVNSCPESKTDGLHVSNK